VTDARPLRAADVVVGCVTEDNAKYLGQALRLVQSIHWFGGELSASRIVVGCVDAIDPRARRALESYGTEVRIVPRFDARNPPSSRLRIFDELRDAPERHFLLLDCDTIVVQDPLPRLRRDVFHAKIAPFPTVTHEVFERLFARFGMELPAQTHVTGYTATPTIPYFNAGVMGIAADLAERLAPEWMRFNAIFAADRSLTAPCEKHMHQAALAMALASTKIPAAEMGMELNYQLNATHVPAPPGYAEIDPVIIHYHHLAGDDGLLLPCPFPRAQQRIDAFNARLRAERSRAMGLSRGETTAAAKRIAVVGMHRSGTSLAGRLLAAMGCYAGEEDDMPAPDVFNPTGYWERRDVWALDEEILAALDATWAEPARADLSSLDAAARETFVARAREIATSLDQHGAWMIKDPRMAILFPLWREALGDPLCVLVWREPAAVARSLAKRDGLPLILGLALWEEYTRAMLASTIGLRRVCISYEELVSQPLATAAKLSHTLDLPVPTEEELRSIVDPALDRHGAGEDDALLNGAQSELRDALRSGAALEWTSVPAIHAATRGALAAYMDRLREGAALRKERADLDALLGATFDSRSWKIGFGLTRRWRKVFPSDEPTVIDRHPERREGVGGAGGTVSAPPGRPGSSLRSE